MTKKSIHSAKYWHFLNILAPGLLWKLREISSILGGPEAIVHSGAQALEQHGLPALLSQKIADGSRKLNIDAEWARLLELEIETLVTGDDDYPERLAQIHSAPPLIYVRGRAQVLGKEGLAVVGSRKLSSYGRNAIKELVPPIASMGANIISGMAYGADSAALEACLEFDGTPVAVLASSLDWAEVAPQAHLALAREIAHAGCLVSEYPPGSQTHKGNFPLRNRIVSGLSVGVLVIEAAAKSGSAITAKLALEQDREVFAVPGTIFAPNSAGTLDMIKRGARCVTSAADIAQEFGWDLKAAAESKLKLDNPMLGKVLDLLRAEPSNPDELIQKLNWPAHQVIASLTELEMAGALRRSNDGVYHKVK